MNASALRRAETSLLASIQNSTEIKHHQSLFAAKFLLVEGCLMLILLNDIQKSKSVEGIHHFIFIFIGFGQPKASLQACPCWDQYATGEDTVEAKWCRRAGDWNSGPMELGNLKLFVVRFVCYLPGTNISPLQGTFESMILLFPFGGIWIKGSVVVSFCCKQAVEVGYFSLWVLVFEKISPLQLSDVVFWVCVRVFLL